MSASQTVKETRWVRRVSPSPEDPAENRSNGLSTIPLGFDPVTRFEHLFPSFDLPFQTFTPGLEPVMPGRNGGGDRSEESDRLIVGDCLHVMRRLSDSTIDLIYADPPFFTGKSFRSRAQSGRSSGEYSDVWSEGLEGYLVWLNARLFEMKRLLKPTGSLFVHLDWHASHYVKCELDRMFGASNFSGEIVWCYETGGTSRKHFPRKHDTILHYSKSPQARFYPQIIRKYLKHRMSRKGVEEEYDPKRRQWYRFKLCPDWWTDVDIVRPDARARVGYPTEKPLPLLDRLIRSATSEGDLVADFFCGGGVTPAAAQGLGRRWIACDLSPVAIDVSHRRLTASAEASDKGIRAPSLERWGVYEIPTQLGARETKAWILACWGALSTRSFRIPRGRPAEEGGLLLGSKNGRLVGVFVTDRVELMAEDVELFLDAVAANHKERSAAPQLVGPPLDRSARIVLGNAIATRRCPPIEYVRYDVSGAKNEARRLSFLPGPRTSRMSVTAVAPLEYRLAVDGVLPVALGAKRSTVEWLAHDVSLSQTTILGQGSVAGCRFDRSHRGRLVTLVACVRDDLGGESVLGTLLTVD